MITSTKRTVQPTSGKAVFTSNGWMHIARCPECDCEHHIPVLPIDEILPPNLNVCCDPCGQKIVAEAMAEFNAQYEHR